jgi:CubicO group peptidase (beta-lactamase class C family)
LIADVEKIVDEQNIGSTGLLNLLNEIHEKKYPVHNLGIIKDNQMILDISLYPYKSDILHHYHSGTKSIISLLIGLLIEDGFIKDENIRLIDYFKDFNLKNLDKNKEDLTLAHFLTMTTGIEWDQNFLYNSIPEPVNFILDRSCESTPGENFSYNNGTAHMLSWFIYLVR